MGSSPTARTKFPLSFLLVVAGKDFYIAGLCKGSTADSDSVCLGSNPSPAARKSDLFRQVAFSMKFACGK